MTAKTAAQRKREQRDRDKQTEDQRLTRLLARTIKLDLFKATDAKLIELMQRLEIDEPQDLLTRLVHGAHRLEPDALHELTQL